MPGRRRPAKPALEVWLGSWSPRHHLPHAPPLRPWGLQLPGAVLGRFLATYPRLRRRFAQAWFSLGFPLVVFSGYVPAVLPQCLAARARRAAAAGSLGRLREARARPAARASATLPNPHQTRECGSTGLTRSTWTPAIPSGPSFTRLVDSLGEEGGPSSVYICPLPPRAAGGVQGARSDRPGAVDRFWHPQRSQMPGEGAKHINA